jgi:predicted nucleotidyltransferase/predicted transcriptional regulator
MANADLNKAKKQKILLGGDCMRIGKNEKINNIPLVKIRDYFKEIRGFGMSETGIRNYFNFSIKSTSCLIKELLKNDFIEKAIDKKYGIEYQLTAKGQSLCAARSVPPLNKAKADIIFNEFMQRIEEINNNDYYLCKVEKALLFGSYLNSENKDFGDIDIAIELKRKIDDFDEYNNARKKRIQEVRQIGKHIANYGEELFYPENEVRLKLKNRSRYISLHEIDDVEKFKTVSFKQIYPTN